MTPAGWVFLGMSWTAIVWLCVWCFAVMFKTRRRG